MDGAIDHRAPELNLNPGKMAGIRVKGYVNGAFKHLA